LHVTVRADLPRDRARVFEIHETAFAGPAEARLVEALRAVASALVSLVAEMSSRGVIGHPTYYRRSGFEPARPHGLLYKSERFDPAFFVVRLAPGALEGFSGEVVYRREFDAV